MKDNSTKTSYPPAREEEKEQDEKVEDEQENKRVDERTEADEEEKEQEEETNKAKRKRENENGKNSGLPSDLRCYDSPPNQKGKGSHSIEDNFHRTRTGTIEIGYRRNSNSQEYLACFPPLHIRSVTSAFFRFFHSLLFNFLTGPWVVRSCNLDVRSIFGDSNIQ